jgi:hypothetical protein
MVTTSTIDENEMRHVARELESENPRWIVVFGVYTRQFVGFPRFNVPSGTFAAALYPGALVSRMHDIEQAARNPRYGDAMQVPSRNVPITHHSENDEFQKYAEVMRGSLG